MGINEMTNELRTMGVSGGLLKLVQAAVRSERSPKAPAIGSDVLAHLREVVGLNQGAFLKLCPSGAYRVFTPEGHAALTAGALKHKPWKAAMAARAKR